MNEQMKEVVDDLENVIATQWREEDKNYFYLTGIGNDRSLIEFHHSLGRDIRNNYNLWQIPWEPELKNGIDYSPFHPDCVSDTIIKEVWKRGLQHKETT